MRKRLVIGGLFALALLLVPSAWAASGRRAHQRAVSPTIRPFTVYGVSTREQRSQLVSWGYDIGERAWPNHVMLYGNKAQALDLTVHGYRVVPQSPDDFPPPDSGYHNYAEMNAEIDQRLAAYPNIMSKRVIGTSYQGRDIVAIFGVHAAW